MKGGAGPPPGAHWQAAIGFSRHDREAGGENAVACFEELRYAGDKDAASCLDALFHVSQKRRRIRDERTRVRRNKMVDIVGAIIGLVINVIILSPVLWLAGRLLVGGQKAKFTDAIMIVVIGVVIGAILGYFVYGWIASIIMLIVWLALIKHFFDCGWLKAFAIAIVTVIIFAVIAVVLALLGFGLFALLI